MENNFIEFKTQEGDYNVYDALIDKTKVVALVSHIYYNSYDSLDKFRNGTTIYFGTRSGDLHMVNVSYTYDEVREKLGI